MGGRVQISLNVVQGQVLNIYIGGQGSNSMSGGWNGGGIGGNQGSGGGGATDIRIGGTNLITEFLWQVVVGVQVYLLFRKYFHL